VRFSTTSHKNSGWRSGTTTSVWRCNAIAVPGDSTTAISAGTYHVQHRNRAVAIRHQREDASDRRMAVRRFNRGGGASWQPSPGANGAGRNCCPQGLKFELSRSEQRFGLISARLHRVGSHYRAATFPGLLSGTTCGTGRGPRPRRYHPHHAGIAPSMRQPNVV
jgi:hypothetical protein